jgi:hypothetical protein
VLTYGTKERLSTKCCASPENKQTNKHKTKRNVFFFFSHVIVSMPKFKKDVVGTPPKNKFAQ